MINEKKSRDPSPLAHLGPPGIARRVAVIKTKTPDDAVSESVRVTKLKTAKQALEKKPQKVARARAKRVSKKRSKGKTMLSEDKPKNKGGRPRKYAIAGEPTPWEKDGIARATYFKRKRAEKRAGKLKETKDGDV